MTTQPRRRRVVSIAAGVAAAVALVAGGTFALAAPSRTATVSVDTTYLQDTLGLPADTVVETVTYDRFQWLLKQPGQFAFLVGSPSDANFAARAVQADAAAKAAGAAKIYWFDPNLVPYTDIRNLNTRVPSGINLAASSQTTYGNTWKNLLGQYLGNGIRSTPNATETSVTIAADDAVVNDGVDPIWDYRSTATPAVADTADVFFVYDKDNTAAGQPDKVVSWVNLSTTVDAPTDLAAALATAGGGAVVDQVSQFEWWKASANRKHDLSYPNDVINGGDIITDEDNVEGWRVKQITYGELLHLLNLKDSADRNFVILFGGTWCHNTRAVIKDINTEAQDNGVTTVYNFDLVLDGGTVNGTNGSANPIHVRDNAYNGGVFNYRPSWVYGDLVRTYLRNLVTEYDPNSGNRVAYYPGGNLTAFPDVVRKLQVPFLINYQRGTGTNPSTTSIKRQWIQQNADASTGLATFKEYMTEWWFVRPSAQLGLNFAIPANESTLSSTQQTQLAQARASVAFAQDGLEKLNAFFGGLPGIVSSTQTVTAPTVNAATQPTITLSIDSAYGRTATGSATLAINGLNYPVALGGNKAVFTVDKLPAGTYSFTITYPGDAAIVGFTKSGSLTVTAAPLSTPVYSGDGPTVTRTVTKTQTVVVTATPEPSEAPSAEPSASASPSPSATPSASPEPSPSPLPSPEGELVAEPTPEAGQGGSGALGIVAIIGGVVGVAGLALGGLAFARQRWGSLG